MSVEPYEGKLETALTTLQSAMSLVRADIAAYPTPISGCDQQYIRLMADQTRLSNAIRSLQARPFVATPRHLEAG